MNCGRMHAERVEGPCSESGRTRAYGQMNACKQVGFKRFRINDAGLAQEGKRGKAARKARRRG